MDQADRSTRDALAALQAGGMPDVWYGPALQVTHRVTRDGRSVVTSIATDDARATYRASRHDDGTYHVFSVPAGRHTLRGVTLAEALAEVQRLRAEVPA